MIDSDIRFGASVPKVPQFYKDMANKPMKKEEGPTTTTTQKTKTNDDCCAIGDEWTSLNLVKCEPYNHDTSLFTFQLSPSTKSLRLPLMGHLLIRKNTSDTENNGTTTKAVRPYTAVYEDENAGTFTLLIKRYQEWGVPEEKLKAQGHVFLYCKTNHSYKPPGIVSNHIHSLQPGKDSLEFLYSDTHNRGHSLSPNTRNLTLIAVGVGIAPMIRLLRHILKPNNDNDNSIQLESIRLLYGVRTVEDILLRPQLEEWNTQYSDKFRAIVCVGSRWSNVHFAAKKTKEHQPPPLPKDYASIHLLEKELGWINADKISKHAASTPDDDKHVIMVCGLPSVYDNLCGPRKDPILSPKSQLYKLGYRDHQVLKF